MEVEKTEEPQECSGGGVTFQADFSVGEEVLRNKIEDAEKRPVFTVGKIKSIRIQMDDTENYRVEYKFESLQGWHEESKLLRMPA